MIPDGGGGAIIIWVDATTGNYAYDIFAQRVLPDGHLAGGWPRDGVPVCAAPGQQIRPAAVADGAHGAIVAWQDVDYRWHVSGQRVSEDGVPLWGPCGVRASHFDSEQFYSGLASDGAGGAILVWSDGRNSAPIPPPRPGRPPTYLHDIYAQRFGPDGVPLWIADGVPVCTDTLDQNGGWITTNGSGVFTIFWSDGRGGIYRQELDLAGNALLAPNGVPVEGHGFGRMTVDGTGGMVSAYAAPGTGLAAQRFTSAGANVWPGIGVDLVDVTSATEEADPTLVPDGTGGAIVTWHDLRNQRDWDVYAQRVTGAGEIAPGWPRTGLPISTTPDFQVYPQITIDSAGGAFIAWMDYRNNQGEPHTYATHVTASGDIAPGWPLDGLLVSGAAGEQVFPVLMPDGAGGVFIAWTDYRVYADIYAQRFSANAAIGGDPSLTATQLALLRVEARAGWVRLEWHTHEGAGFQALLERRTGSQAWGARARLAADASGMLIFEDRDVIAEERYGYRIALPDGSRSQEVWVEVPSRDRFELEGLRPNPGLRGALVSFSLPTDEHATVELYDLGGRRLWIRELASAGAGRHLIRIDRDQVPPGVYLLRLTQSGRSATARACFLE